LVSRHDGVEVVFVLVGRWFEVEVEMWLDVAVDVS
jgi:hypothetical protein